MMIRLLLRTLAADPNIKPAFAETCRFLLTTISMCECRTDQDIVGLMVGMLSAQRHEIEALQRKALPPCP